MLRVEKYETFHKAAWDQLVSEGINSSFLFYRDFMEYHADRFTDHSLIMTKGSKIIGLLPANVVNHQLYSHQGLTYGGFVLSPELKYSEINDLFVAALKFLHQSGIKDFYLKKMPWIYNNKPFNDLDWPLFICDAKLYRRDVSMAVRRADKQRYQKRRLRAIKKAKNLNPIILTGEGDLGFKNFWKKVLEPNLRARHQVAPVHSVNEIMMLANRFPTHIRQYNIYVESEIMAGTNLFVNPNVVHAQYIASSDEGKGNGCLDYLIDYLIRNCEEQVPYFDFGISNERDGTIINNGLLEWKEGFGAKAVSHDFYNIHTNSYKMICSKISNK